MSTGDYPTDPNAETIGLPSDDSGKGSVPELGKFATQGMPTEIGRYRILGIIASGGMGVVYEAMQEAPRRRVALKIIKAGAASEMALHRFHFEAQTLAKLSHSNIAQIYEAGTWESENGEVPFFAMEYIPGARGIVSYAEQKGLTLKDRLILFAKICDAVHHGHQKGVIHRDLKPDNILVDNKGNPKIIDFGVARATDADLAVTTMQTTMGQLIGTLQYMSPEQCDADPDRIDTRSDVYALGVILFQLLSGELPYDLRRQAIHEAVRVIKETRPASLSTVNTTLKGDVDNIALKAMEKDRDRRYQSAAELASDINHFLNNEPIIARPLSIGYQVRLFTKKYKRTCAAVVLLAVSIVLGLFGTTWGMVEASRQRVIAEKQKQIAEDRYESILSMSRDFIGDFYNGIVKLNAAISVRQHVLEQTFSHLDKLEATAGETDEILLEKAKTNYRLGNLYAGTNAANLGDRKQAALHHQQGLAQFEALVENGRIDCHYYVALEHTQLANLLFIDKSYGEAIAAFQKSNSVIDTVLLTTPSDSKALRLQDRNNMRLVDIYRKTDRMDQAMAILDGHISSVKQRALDKPNDLPLQRDYANGLLRAASAKLAMKDYSAAIEQYTDAINIYKELMSLEPENGRAPKDLAWAHFFLGEARLVSGEDMLGFNELELGLALIRDRAVAFPKDEDARAQIVLYLEEYLNFCSAHDQNKRGKTNTFSVVLALQPVMEANPENYAFSNTFSTIEKMYQEVSQRATAN